MRIATCWSSAPGPAGLAAALAAAAGGARVILCRRAVGAGGSLLDGCAASIDGEMADAWLAWSLAELAGNPRVRVMPRTTAFGYFPHNTVGLIERLTDHLASPADGRARERLWQVRAREVVLATGAIEQPLVFPGNDRPGVMLAGAARSYLGRYGVRAGTRAVVVTTTDGAYRDGARPGSGGIEVAAIADLRAKAPDGRGRSARARCGHRGPRRAPACAARAAGCASSPHRRSHGRRRCACDLVLMSGGFAPACTSSRSRAAGCTGATRRAPSCRRVSAERAHPAGAGRGVFGLGAALADGAAAGVAAARASGHPAPAMRFEVSGGERLPESAGAAAKRPAGTGPKAFVDFQNDVTARDLALATREGFRSIEHVKRYTTTGMATDQGKTSSLNALGIIAAGLGKPVPEVGHTTFRMPYTPVSFGSLAGLARGALFDPVRTTPMHESGRAPRRGVRGRRPVEARALFPARRRGHARGGRARVPRGAHRRRHLRRLDARQDRRRRSRRGGVPEPALRQRLLGSRAGALALRDPAARRRFHLRRRRDRAPRAGPLPRDDDDRRRRARARDDGGLPPDGMDRPRGLADLGHRAVGRHRRAGTARAAGARAARAGHRPAAVLAAAHGGGGWPRRAARPRWSFA